MDGLTDIINSSNITEIGLPIIFTVLVAWMSSRNSDKSQDQQMLHNEQINKLLQTISTFQDRLLTLSSEINENNEKAGAISHKLDGLNHQIELLDNEINELKQELGKQTINPKGRNDGG